MNISSWAGCCRTPKSTKITRKHRLQFLGRMLQRQKRQKSPSFIVKTPVNSIGEHRKVRELPRKMKIEEVEAPKKYENLQTKPVLDPFKSTADTRKVRELPRKMKIEEVEEPETMKIYRQNPCASARPPRKLRKFTDETNMQARNHENSDEIRPTPVRHLDLATPAFYYYRKNPKCYHTVWGMRSMTDFKINVLDRGIQLYFSLFIHLPLGTIICHVFTLKMSEPKQLKERIFCETSDVRTSEPCYILSFSPCQVGL